MHLLDHHFGPKTDSVIWVGACVRADIAAQLVDLPSWYVSAFS